MDRLRVEEIFEDLKTSEELRAKFWDADTKEEQDQVMKEALQAAIPEGAEKLAEESLDTVSGGRNPGSFGVSVYVYYRCTHCGWQVGPGNPDSLINKAYEHLWFSECMKNGGKIETIVR
jgi:hypothetical protein